MRLSFALICRFLFPFLLAVKGLAAEAQTLSLYRFEPSNQKQMDSVADQYEIIARDGSRYEVYVPLEKAKTFEALVPRAELLKVDADAEWKKELFQNPAFVTGYHDFAAVQEFMSQVCKDYPKLATQGTYGKTKKGYPLTYLRLGASSTKNKPKIFLDAATHGDELISVEVLIQLVDELLKGYGQDPRLTRMLDETEIVVSLVVNPDGFTNQSRYEGGVDPNRSYPWPDDPDQKPTLSIQALMDLFAKEMFAGSISFHAYGRLLMYPWAYTYDPIEDAGDQLFFESLTEKLAAENGYTYGPIASTIYIAKGSSVDYYYWKFKTRALAVELSGNKVPRPEKIPDSVNEAREMVWQFVESFYQR